VILPFKIILGDKMEFLLHPKLKKAGKIIAENEFLYMTYFGLLTIFAKVTTKIVPDEE
jgi:hypothetical protein